MATEKRGVGVVLAIDAVGAKYGGVATVLRSIVDAALADERVGRVVLFASPARARLFSLPNDARLTLREPSWAESSLGRVGWYAQGLGREVERAEADVLLCLGVGGVPPPGVPSVVLVQQSLLFSEEALALMPERRLRFAMVRATLSEACARAALVVAQTETMARLLRENFGLASARIAVVRTPPPAVDMRRSVTGDRLRALAEPRLLYVGNGEPYKNLRVAVDGVRLLRAQGIEAALAVTLAASVVPSEPFVHALGAVPQGELGDAYGAATALVMPSLTETVGLPLLEAMSVGTPVVCADRPYAHDTCGTAMVPFDPHDAGDFARAVRRLVERSALRDELRARGLARIAELRSERPYGALLDPLVCLGGWTEGTSTSQRPPLISVVTVCRNAEATLARAIESVRAQRYPHIEYIVVDGASTDGTRNIIERNAASIARVVSEPDRGIYDAMNKAVALGTGDYVYFLGADDRLLDEGVIERIARQIARYPSADIVCGCVLCVDPTSSATRWAGAPLSVAELRDGAMAPHQGMFVRRELYQRFPFDERYRLAGDFDFLARALRAGARFVYVDEPVAAYAIGGLTAQRERRLIAEKRRIIRALFGLTAFELRAALLDARSRAKGLPFGAALVSAWRTRAWRSKRDTGGARGK